MDDKLLSVCELTAEQKKAFKKLEKAYKECEKTGIYFANNYGNLMAFDSSLVAGYGDNSFHRVVNMKYGLIMDARQIA